MSDSDLDRRLAGLADVAGRAATVPVARDVRRRAHTRTVRRRVAVGVVALVGLAVGGFSVWKLPPSEPDIGVTSPPSTAAPSVTDSGPQATSNSQPSNSQPSMSHSQSTGTPECIAAGLSVTLGQSTAAAGHRGIEVVFRNVGTTGCRMRGYPGVDGLAADGTLIAHATRTMSGYLGGVRGNTLPTAILQPGQSTTATVEGTASTPDGGSCAGVKKLLVTAPDETYSTTLEWDTDICGNLQVHPIAG
jgi:hypothetical protein